ncbi:Bromodomain associated domain [Trinorchestia longiramus]|nr:Bromodomain associated domain [Trinorchestia longiramus]
MEPNFQHEALKKCVALICQGIGFQGIYAMPLEVLTDLLHRYLREVAVLTHSFAEHDNRTVPTVGDLSYAFLEMKVSLPELEEFTNSVDGIPFPDPVPKFPLPRTSELNFLKPGSREILSRPLHIHEHLPPMLPDLQEDGKDGSSGSPHMDQNGGEVTGEDHLSNGQASPASLSAFLSSAQRQQRSDHPDHVNGLDGEGDPVREIDSVMMTTSGFISSAREGKLPEARLPQIPLPVIPHQAPTSRSSSSSSRNSAPASANALAQSIAAKKKMSLERLMRHKHNMALKKAAQNALNGISNNSNTSTPKNKSAKKSLSHSAVLSMAGAAVDSSFCFTTKHGKSKDKLKPKIPPTPPGTSRFLTPSTQTVTPKPSGVPMLGTVGTPLGPPPKLKIPTPRQKQPEFSTDVLPLPKEDPKEQQERELQLQRKKEKQKELARAARSGMLGAIVAGSAGKDVDDLSGLVDAEVRPNKIPSSSSLLSDALKPKKDKKEKEGKKDLKKLSKEGRKDKDKKEKDKSESKKEKPLKKKEDKGKKDRKDLKKKEKDGSKKLKDTSKKEIKKDKEKKSKEGKVKLKDKEKKDKKVKKGSESPAIKSPKLVTVRQETPEAPVRDPTPVHPRLDRDPITSPPSATDFSPEAGKSKLCVFKKSSKSQPKQDAVLDEMTIDKPNLSVADHSFNVADASADLSGVLSSPSIAASPFDSSNKVSKQKKRKRAHDNSDSPGGPLIPKIKKSKLNSPRAKSTKNSLDFSVMPEVMDDNASPFSGSGMSGLPSMECWENRPTTPSTPDNSLISKAPSTPGVYPPLNMFSGNTFSPLGDMHEPFAHQEQLETPLTPGQGRTPEHSSRGVTPSSCSNADTPQSVSSSGPSPSPPDGELSAGPLSPFPSEAAPNMHGLSDNERKKKEKEYRKEKKEKEKIKKKKDKKLKEKLEKKLKEKQQKKEKKKKKLLVGTESLDGPLLQGPAEVVPPTAPKLVIKRSEPCDSSSSISSFSVSSTLPVDSSAPPPPPPSLSRDDQPGSPEIAKISALVTRPPKPSGASVKDKSKGSSAHKDSREPTPPGHKIKEAKTSKDRDRSSTPPDATLRMVPPLKIKSAPLDEKPASSKKTSPAASSSSHRSGGSSSSSSKSSSGLTTTTIASVPVLPVVIPPVLPAEPLPAPVVADAVSSIGHFVDDQGNEVWICPTCGKQDDGSPMIGCDTCDDWYHWVCVGIQVPPNESENWYCPRCLAQHKQRNPHDNSKRDKRKHHHHRKKK